MIVLDTNLLVYAHRRATPEHKQAQKVIAKALERGCAITVQTLVEFWAVVTSEAISIRPSTIGEASGFLNALFAAELAVWNPTAEFAVEFIRTAAETKVSGHRAHDLAIAVTARAHGGRELWTNDRRFVRVKGLALKFPLEAR